MIVVVKQYRIRLAVDEAASDHEIAELIRDAATLLAVDRKGPVVQVMGMEIDADANRRLAGERDLHGVAGGDREPGAAGGEPGVPAAGS